MSHQITAGQLAQLRKLADRIEQRIRSAQQDLIAAQRMTDELTCALHDLPAPAAPPAPCTCAVRYQLSQIPGADLDQLAPPCPHHDLTDADDLDCGYFRAHNQHHAACCPIGRRDAALDSLRKRLSGETS